MSTQTAPAAPTTGPTRCFPRGLPEHKAIQARDGAWMYECDLCLHQVTARTDFNRHMVEGPGRVGFKIWWVDPTAALIWYGKDDAGNEYRGNMVGRTAGTPNQSTTIGPPCGAGVRAAAAQKRADKKGGNNGDGAGKGGGAGKHQGAGTQGANPIQFVMVNPGGS